MPKANLKNEEFFLRLTAKGKLKVTKSGRAYNLVTEKEIAKAKPGSTSYRKLSWLNKKTGKIVQVQLHRIVWAAFNGVPDDPDLEVNHKDACKQNCRLSNLELITGTANTEHARTLGLIPVPLGGARSNSVFSDKQVTRFRRKVKAGTLTAKDIAEKVGCNVVTVYYMLRGKTYSHI